MPSVSVVAGVFSFGTATVAGAKAGVRTLIKAGGKVALSAAKKQMAALALKNGPKNIRSFAAKIPRLCVTACFPAGTPVAVESGYKNIEELVVGDLVWSWHEQTGNLALKPVVQTTQRASDALIELRIGADVVRATAEHPFWVNGGWKVAGELVVGDAVLRSDGLSMPVSEVVHHSEQPTTVYNFEVADWHTYLVSWWMFVVHNATCIAELTTAAKKAAQEWIQLHKNRLKQSITQRAAAAVLETADALQSLRKKIRPGAAGAMELKDGSVIVGHSQKGLPKGVLPDNLHPDVKKVLDDIPDAERSVGHGECAEPQIITEALNNGKDVKGAKSVAVEVQTPTATSHGTPKCACKSCKVLLDHFQIEDLVKPE